MFSHAQSKHVHMKKCKVAPTVINNTTYNTTNNNTTNNITTNNNTTNNTQNNINIEGNIIIYSDQFIEFDDSHVSKKDLKCAFHGVQKTAMDGILKFAQILMRNKRNRCVRKRHVTNSYCQVHVGNNNWVIRPDRHVMRSISLNAASLATDRLYENPKIGTPEVRQAITDIASYDDVFDKNKELVREVRSVILQTTKDSESEAEKLFPAHNPSQSLEV